VADGDLAVIAARRLVAPGIPRVDIPQPGPRADRAGTRLRYGRPGASRAVQRPSRLAKSTA